MSTPTTVHRTDLPGLKRLHEGKVRDLYEVDAQHMLIVTTDRLSAFDVILPDPIPGKGQVLSEVSAFWFRQLADLVPNHLTDIRPEDVVNSDDERRQVAGRSVVVKRLKALPVEAIVRGYLIGSGWKDYQRTGAVCGIELPAELELAAKLPQTLYTPSTKADVGGHDENIDYARTEQLLGADVAARVRELAIAIYERAAAYARERGIIIADTKFEFGLDDKGEVVLIDEVLTPDSSRFWPADQWQPGHNPPSFDKQFVRDYLETLDWDKTPPGPELPETIIRQTAEKYEEARRRLLQ